MHGSWRESETWHHEKTGETIGEGGGSVAVEFLKLKGSWREVEARHNVAGPESLKSTQKKLLVELHQSAGTAKTWDL